MQKVSTRRYQTGFVRRYAAFALITVFGYLCEVCIMPYIRPFGISPKLNGCAYLIESVLRAGEDELLLRNLSRGLYVELARSTDSIR